MDIIGYIAAFFIGISLGLIGGGGSILAVPVFVYFFGFSPLIAISYSLLVVGATSLVGAANNYKKGLVNFKTAMFFGVFSIITVFITRKFIIPAIPSTIDLGLFTVSFSTLTMVLFAALMVIASIAMLRRRKEATVQTVSSHNYILLSLYGMGIGLITGFLGAGGGFILIPALVMLLGLPMKTAVGTSLLIIALNSLVGFFADAGRHNVQWPLLITVSLVAIAGVLFGGYISRNIRGDKLKKGFGWFVLVIGVCIILEQILQN